MSAGPGERELKWLTFPRGPVTRSAPERRPTDAVVLEESRVLQVRGNRPFFAEPGR
jgi:hypothetical protein